MSKRKRTIPRKLPTQSRSRATVEAILTATARLLRRDGYDALSTNKVAQAAGVSVGSLYQYFPSKEALFMAVMDTHCTQLSLALEGRLVALAQASIEVVARAMVDEMISLHRVDPRLHRVLMQQAPHLSPTSRILEMRHRFAELLAVYLEAHAAEVEIEDFKLAAHLLTLSVDALTDDAVLTHPELLESQAFRDDVVRMVLCYLAPTRARELMARLEDGEVRTGAAG